MSDESDNPMPRYSPELVPEISLTYHHDLATSEATFPPYFITDWPAGQALARYLLDHPELVRDKRVLDFGTGAGMLAIAAALAGATHVRAIDRDTRAIEAARRNAAGMGLAIEVLGGDPLDGDREVIDGVDVIVAGDVLYPEAGPDRVWPWLAAMARTGRRVLVADPGRIQQLPPGLRGVWHVRTAAGVSCDVYEIDVAALPPEDVPDVIDD
jgi:predicted nicotinamide N-methyase